MDTETRTSYRAEDGSVVEFSLEDLVEVFKQLESRAPRSQKVDHWALTLREICAALNVSLGIGRRLCNEWLEAGWVETCMARKPNRWNKIHPVCAYKINDGLLKEMIGDFGADA